MLQLISTSVLLVPIIAIFLLARCHSLPVLARERARASLSPPPASGTGGQARPVNVSLSESPPPYNASGPDDRPTDPRTRPRARHFMGLAPVASHGPTVQLGAEGWKLYA